VSSEGNKQRGKRLMRRLAIQLPALAALAAFAFTAPAFAQDIPTLQATQIITDPGRIPPDDTDFGYGCAVAVDGKNAAVYAAALGIVFVYQRQGGEWVETQQIPVQPIQCHLATVALEGRRLIFNDAGVLRVLRRQGNTWQPQTTVEAEDGAALTDALLDGDTLAASGDGAAYVFVRSGTEWIQQARIIPAGETTATALALDGDTLVIAEGLQFTSESRAVYVFVREGGTWIQEQQLIPSGEVVVSPHTGTAFGAAGAIDGDTIVIGAPDDGEEADEEGPLGAAFVFVRENGTWIQQQKLTTPFDLTNFYRSFGQALVIQDDLIVVGAPGGGSRTHFSTGLSYGFIREGDTWTEAFRSGASTGASLSISGHTLLAGQPGVGEIFLDGRVAFFDLRRLPDPSAETGL
jgi:hypothetical protein